MLISTGHAVAAAEPVAAAIVDQGEPAPIPADVADSIVHGPIDVVVGFDAASAATAFADAGVAGIDPTQRDSTVADAQTALAADKDAALTVAADGVQTVQEFDHLPVEVVRVATPEALQELAAAPGVTSLALPRQYRLSADPDLTIIGQPQAQALGFTGAGVSVAVIDTGVNYLGAAASAVFGDCSRGPGTGSCRIDRSVSLVGSTTLDADPNGHGTNVSGIVARTAPGAHLDVYGVFDPAGSATDATILRALNDITANGPARGIRAVNMSFGDVSFHVDECTASAYSSVFVNLRALGILPVVAAGNSGANSGQFQAGVAEPACATGAVSVGATYPRSYPGYDLNWRACTDAEPAVDQIPCFSQTGPTLSVLAPGVDITAAGFTESGTSQAAPHAAGAVAVVAAANPTATADQVAGFVTGTGPRITDPRTGGVVRRLDLAAAAAAAASAARMRTPGGFVSLAPTRLLDTRHGNGATGPVPGFGSIDVQVTGQGGVPPSGVSAVVLNVTATEPAATGFITAFGAGTAVPLASNLNFVAGQTVPNLVVVPVGGNGKVTLFNGSPGATHLIADLAGYYLGGAVTSAGAFTSLAPARLLDTRTGNGAPQAVVQGLATVDVTVAGRAGVPAAGSVSAVVLNVTATEPAVAGFITAFAAGAPLPVASNLNFAAGQTAPNLVVVPVGVDGKVTLYNGSGAAVHLIADIAGYYRAGTAAAAGAFTSVPPTRLLDTRTNNGGHQGVVQGFGTVPVSVAGRAGVPATGTVSAVVLNVTVTEPATGGFITAFATGGAVPLASNLNFLAGQTVPNLVMVPVGADGTVTLFVGAPGAVHVIADIAGYYR